MYKLLQFCQNSYTEGVIFIQRKKIKIILTGFIILSSLLVYAIKQTKAKELNSNVRQISNLDETSINYLNFEKELFIEDKDYYLWFCDLEDDSCKYLDNEYIQPILKTLRAEEFENLIKVDFSTSEMSKEKLRSKYNVESKLAFVKATRENGVITYSDALSWDDEKPFSKEALKNWLYEHNIYQNTYDKIGK